MDDRHAEALASSLTELSEALTEVGDGRDIAELRDLVRRPGWATEPEYELVASMTKSLTGQVKSVTETKVALFRFISATKSKNPDPPPGGKPPPPPPPPGPDGPPGPVGG
jgi:hypothetical protein